MKKFLVIVTLIFVVTGVFAFKAAMVTDLTGLSASKETAGFNDIAWWGFERARDELGVEILLVESREQSDYVFLLTDAVNEVAPEYPEIKFAIVDSVVNDLPNTASYVFMEEQGSFLAGYLAAKLSKTGVIGFIGGMEVPTIKKFETGYIAGAKYARKDIEVSVIYVGSFTDPASGREAARILHNNGADIIYHAAGSTGIGMIQYAAEKGILAIGVDTDQSSLAPKTVVASMMKRVDIATFEAIKGAMTGNFVSGIHVLGLAEGGVDLKYNSQCPVPENLKKEIEEVKANLISGKLFAPSTTEELDSFLRKFIIDN